MKAPDEVKLVLLGTGGGPLPSVTRSGISQAVVVGERLHLVDCGAGVTRQLRRARLLRALHGVYLTHLHSDHACDYFDLFLLGWPVLQWNPPVHVHGPGPAGGASALPSEEQGKAAFPLVNPTNPTPGLVATTDLMFQAFAYDINIRLREAGRSDLRALILPHEVSIPDNVHAKAPDVVAPLMAPILVTEDDDVRVTAVLVMHAPVFPAFAFRFDTDRGSIVISGDTAPCQNLINLARGADVLVHEVYNDRPVHGSDASDHTRFGPRRPPGDPRMLVLQAQRRHLVSSHTPLSAVGKVAAEACVARLVLTHFVVGDDQIPDKHWLEAVSSDFDGEVTVGHDLTELRLG